MRIFMLRFLGELTSQIVVDLDDQNSCPTTSGGEPVCEVVRYRNMETLGGNDISEKQLLQTNGSP